jgi:chaperonin GroES|tara:strand:- start:1427 stop:1687 length:261 start_codon:yes stop_codon:yes gene_type:complete
MAKQIVPVGDRIIISTLEAEQKSAGGLIIPDSNQKKPSLGLVIESNSLLAEVGDTVVYGDYAGQKISFDDKDFIILEEAQILAKIV